MDQYLRQALEALEKIERIGLSSSLRQLAQDDSYENRQLALQAIDKASSVVSKLGYSMNIINAILEGDAAGADQG